MNSSSKPIRFLLVEDDPAHAELVRISFERSGATNPIDHVTDGAQALQFLRREDPFTDSPRPDVILLDLNIPKVDGLGVLITVKNDPKLCAIPVVILSTSSSDSDINQAYGLHVNSYITKPMDFDVYQRTITDMEEYWSKTSRTPNPERSDDQPEPVATTPPNA